MLITQKRYLTYLRRAIDLIKEAKLDSSTIEALADSLDESELLIPVIGAFSAGKSSMINCFLDRELLPVDITAETELATELRFGKDERIEAVSKTGAFEMFELAQMDEVKRRACDFAYLRIYIESPELKSIEPLVLVDMPGFDSSFENHNKAISYYIDKGAHYIVLTSVEDGTITRSMQRQLSDVLEMGPSCSLFVSKANLRSVGEVEDVVEKVRDQWEVLFDEKITVLPIGNESVREVRNCITNIDPEVLFQKMFERSLKDEHMRLIDNLNIAISTLEGDAESNTNAIEEMKASVDCIVAQRDVLVKDIREQHSGSGVNRCTQAVGHALMNAMDELVGYAATGNQDALGAAISEISRSVLLREVKKQMKSVSEEVADKLALEIKAINTVMGGLDVGDSWIEGFTSKVKGGVEYTNSALGKLSTHLSTSDNTSTGTLYKALSTILAVTTSVVVPAVELLIIFLPEILSFFVEKKRKEELRNTIAQKVIPDIKRKLEEKLPLVFDEQLNAMTQSIVDQFEVAIREKQETISKFSEEKKGDIDQINERVADLKRVLDELRQLATKLIYQEA